MKWIRIRRIMNQKLKLKNKLKKEINIINKNLELNKQILINQIRRKAF